MGKLSEGLAKAADNAERLAAALGSIPSSGSDAGGGATAGGGGLVPPQAVFNTTVNLAGTSSSLTRTSGGGSGGGGSKIFPDSGAGSMPIEFIRFLNARGIWDTKNTSKLLIENLMREFERLMKKNDLGLALRTSV